MSSKMVFKRTGPGLEKTLERIKKPGTVDVGVIGDSHSDEDGNTLSTATIALWLEFGTATSPERSFMRSTLLSKRKEIIKLQKKLLKKIINGELDINKALGLLGLFVSDEMRETLIKLSSPPNSPYTIAQKKSSNPGIDTSQTKNAITFEVNK